MTITVTLSGNSSLLTADYFPPIELNQNQDYVCGLVDFQTYNSIPNVDLTNNLFHIGNQIIEIPVGSYELDDIANFIRAALLKLKNGYNVNIWANNNTLKSVLTSNTQVYFNKARTIGSLLGFSPNELIPNVLHVSDMPVKIIKVNTIRVECNIIDGAYINNTRAHTLHEFSPAVGPGYKIVEVPRNVIYLPVNVREITSIVVKLVDQDGDLINFREETITVRIHIKPHNVNF